MTARPWTRGRTVVDGELQYVSPSQVVSADHESFGGCLRRWYYRKVEGRPEPEGESQKVGTRGHGEIEDYLHTGQMVLGQHAINAKRFLPPPSPELQLEVPIDDGTLLLAGVPVVGFIDYLNTSGRVVLDHGDLEDPDRSAEVVDWKFTGRRDFPSAHEVATAIPMVIYGEWAARRLALEWVRLSHVYISTRRREVSKRSLRINRSELAPTWERAERVVRRLVQAARCASASDVDANTDACTAYGGCPHRSYCTASTERTLIDLLGATAAANLTKEKDMSLLNIPALAALKGPVADEKAKLLAEEAAAKVDPAVVAAVAAIRASGYGQPTLTGAAAQAWAAATGLDYQGDGLAGSGVLAQATFSDPADLIKAADELRGLPAPAAAPAAVQAAGLLPPDAPASDPVAALAAIEGQKAPAPVEVMTVSNTPPAATVPSETVAAQLTATTTAPAVNPRTGGTLTDEQINENTLPSADAGELKLSKKARAEFERLQARIAELEAQARACATVTITERAGDISRTTTTPMPAAVDVLEVFVDCFPPEGAKDLAPWVQTYADMLAKQYGAADIRCASNDTPLGFGRWKGALVALLREAPPAPGAYYLDARGSELAEAAVEALRTRARVVRGLR